VRQKVVQEPGALGTGKGESNSIWAECRGWQEYKGWRHRFIMCIYSYVSTLYAHHAHTPHLRYAGYVHIQLSLRLLEDWFHDSLNYQIQGCTSPLCKMHALVYLKSSLGYYGTWSTSYIVTIPM
jgi:hypothetical protein